VSTPTPSLRRLIAFAVVVLAPVVLLSGPVLISVALIVDLTLARRLRFTRLIAMTIHAIVLEWTGVMAAVLLWVGTGFGVAMNTTWSRRAHYRVQRWWGGAMLGAAQRWLHLEVRFDGLDLIGDGPLILACQHTSFFDALLPTSVLAQHSNRAARHVLKRELAWDPCLALFGNRHPNHFVARTGAARQTELAAIEKLAASAGDEALVIFPEGTFYSPKRAAKITGRLARQDPERNARLDLKSLLPPRPGGITALLRGRPSTDVVFMAHVGFEAFGSLRSILANVPFTEPVAVKLWRIGSADMPADPVNQIVLIDRQWQIMDDWAFEQKI